jgi:hypothetical protein
MVRLIRSAEAKIGMFPQSVAFAKKIAAYVKKAYKVDIKVYANSKGVLFWIVDYKDYSDYDRARAMLASDKKYWQIVSTAKNLFVEGSLCDELVSPID